MTRQRSKLLNNKDYIQNLFDYVTMKKLTIIKTIIFVAFIVFALLNFMGFIVPSITAFVGLVSIALLFQDEAIDEQNLSKTKKNKEKEIAKRNNRLPHIFITLLTLSISIYATVKLNNKNHCLKEAKEFTSFKQCSMRNKNIKLIN